VIILKAWIGHYKGNPTEWFVVWAKDRQEAFLQIDPIVAEPDMKSLMELSAPGFANFTASYDKKKGKLTFSPSAEDVKAGYWLVFGGALGKNDDIGNHITSRMKKASHI
jgi:hypothetical protein